jgi:hypothetical protein
LDGDVSGTLVPGQIVRLEIEEMVTAEGFWLPSTSLVRGQRGLWSCYVAVGVDGTDGQQRLERRDVELLHTTGDRVLVRGTVQAGDAVVASGAHRIVSGQLVINATPSASTENTLRVAASPSRTD